MDPQLTTFAITAGVAVAMSIAIAVMTGRVPQNETRLFGFLLGQAGALLGVGWAVAGLLYLTTGFQVSRGTLAWVSILVMAIVAFFAYQGMTL